MDINSYFPVGSHPPVAPTPVASQQQWQALGYFASMAPPHAFSSAPPVAPPRPPMMPPPSTSGHRRGGGGFQQRGGRGGRFSQQQKQQQKQQQQQHLGVADKKQKKRGRSNRGFHHHGKGKGGAAPARWQAGAAAAATAAARARGGAPRAGLPLSADMRGILPRSPPPRPFARTHVHPHRALAYSWNLLCLPPAAASAPASCSPPAFIIPEDRTPLVMDAPNAPDNSTQSFLAPGA